MRLLLKVAAAVAALFFGLVLIGLAYVSFAFPKVGPAPDLKIASTPERLARGRYLANNVCACLDCHSQRDWTLYSGPVKPGTEGVGGERFPLDVGELYAPNLTPAHLGDWSDGELYRAIAEGVSRDGRTLFPLMPYPRYGKMDREDVEAIIVYLRTLKPLQYQVPATRLKFPMNFLVRTIPKPAAHEKLPAEQLALGKYLVHAGACADCHTPIERGATVPGMDLAGGMEFELPDGQRLRSANITPDARTGIGRWTEKQFVQRFRNHKTPAMKPGERNTIMPWTNYSGMTESDLAAIYAYLRTVTPVSHSI